MDVIGKISVEGMLKRTNKDKPRSEVVITNCG